MITLLRKKFIRTAMASVIIVLFAILTAINILNYRSYVDDCNRRIDMIEASGGNLDEMRSNASDPPGAPSDASSDAAAPPDKPSGDGSPSDDGMSIESLYDTRYFSADLDQDKQIISLNMTDIASISSDDAEQMISDVVSKGRTSGQTGSYRYRLVQSDNSHYLIIFLNVSSYFSSVKSFLGSSLLVGAIGIAAVFLLMRFLTKLAMRPAEEAFEKQKQFITDASHEIKTPLAIISSNAEAIEMDNGDSRWLTNIRNQISRLSALTEKLVLLSRMDEAGYQTELSEFDLTELVKNTADQYQKRQINVIAPDYLPYFGSRENITKCFSMIFDNAMKYSTGDVTVTISGRPVRSSKIKRHGYTIVCSNPCESIQQGSLDVLFDRFARLDSSRTRKTGGSGIGLAVVFEIVKMHKGEAHAFSGDGKNFEIRITL
ncbi:MAG: sensor histidine kinase [Candidatus Weimeria sp.]